MTTKTEVKKMAVEDLRALLDQYFDIEGDATKTQLIAIVDDNWDEFLNEALNPVEEIEDEPDEVEADGEEEEVEEELEEFDPDMPNPRTDLAR